MLDKILSLHKQSGSDDLSWLVWEQICINGTRSLYVITIYQVCPKPTSSKMETAWHQQYQGQTQTHANASWLIWESFGPKSVMMELIIY
jgi:hypothetical protein